MTDFWLINRLSMTMIKLVVILNRYLKENILVQPVCNCIFIWNLWKLPGGLKVTRLVVAQWLQMIVIIFAYKDYKIRSLELYLGHKMHCAQWEFAPLDTFYALSVFVNGKTYHN